MIGLDGLDPDITEAMLAAGELPALARLRARGFYSRLATTFPAQTPVAWSTFATGCNPGVHGVFDFLTRDPATYTIQNALFRYERRSAFLPPRAVNLRGGDPVWSVLAGAGVSATVLRHPCTFPPSDGARQLAGVGVPDLRGGFGASTWLTTDEATSSSDSEQVVRLTPAAGGLEGYLPGPASSDRGESRVKVVVERNADGVTVRSDGEPRELSVRSGSWSGWLRVKFRLGALQSARGLVRFYLTRSTPEIALHASPVSFDPDEPLFPISAPWGYAAELRRELGLYHTLGMAEDHGGLDAGRLDEPAFLEQCGTVMSERRAMLMRELDRFDDGLLFCLFDTPDRIQHMMWRFREGDHPTNREHPTDGRFSRAIEEHYRECDDIVEDVLEAAGDDALVLVSSDHGFTSFQRELHLNAWLRKEGLLTLRAGAEPGREDLLNGVDWSRTRAYALGLGGIFINRKGREGEGVVDDGEAELLMDRISRALPAVRDPERMGPPVRRVLRASDLYHGARAASAPDLLVSCASGWRVSTATALGGVPAEVFSDNRRRWSGDHVVDPELVPGVLFSSRTLTSRSPTLQDLAPTILDALAVPVPDTMEGRSLLP